MNVTLGRSRLRLCSLVGMLTLLVGGSPYAFGATTPSASQDQVQAQQAAEQQAPAQQVPSQQMPPQEVPAQQAPEQDAARAQADARARVDAAIRQIRTACQVSDTETDPKKVNKQADCVARAVAAQKRKLNTENALRSTLNQAFGGTAVRTPAPPVPSVPTTTAGSQPTYVGASASGTPSTCGPGTGSNNPLIRVHRLLMAPKNASDDFGYRLGRRFFVYQVTISNDSTDHQFLIHDVSVDLSALFSAPPGTYLYAASSQDLSLLRGIPEKGQDLDKRNLTLHLLQGIGSVAAGVSGLTSFSGVMGSSVAVFNGPFLQAYVGLAPDHTSTQLNRLSDSAYITNTLVDKQRAKILAIFIPQATLLSDAQQREYWKEPHAFLEGVLNLNQADVCVDGAFITTVATPPTLTAATLTPRTPGAQLAPNVLATLTIQGTNLLAGDTQVVGLGPTMTLSAASGTSASLDLTLPANYTSGMQIHLTSAANPSFTSAAVAITTAPTLTSATLTPKVRGTTLARGVAAILTVQGSNLVANDTQVVGFGVTVTLSAATGTTGTVDLTLPATYTAGMQVHLASTANPSLTSAAVSTTEGP